MLAPLWAPLRTRLPSRRGGWRQRMAAEDEPALPSPVISRLFGNLLLDWSDGLMSARKLQFTAANALYDGFDHPMAHRLAQAGAGQNAQQGLLSLLRGCGVADLLTVYPDEEVTHLMLPSTWLKVVSQYPSDFALQLGADRARLRQFWKGFMSSPNHVTVRAHPAIGDSSLSELVNVVPLCVHSDGAPFTKTKSCFTISFSSLLGLGDAKQTKFAICSFIKSKNERGHWPAWQHVVDDLEALATGVVNGEVVATNSDGTPWRFALLFVKSDEDVRSNEFKLAHFSGAIEVCSECLANREERPWTDSSRDSAWRPTERMPLETYRARIAEPHHPVVASRMFCHRHFFMLDIMHLLDCNGVSSLVIGSTLMWLMADIRLGRNRAARLERVNGERAGFYEPKPGVSRLPMLKEKCFVQSGWGELHGPAFKAAVTRHAVPFFHELVCKYCTAATPRDTCLTQTLASLVKIYDVMYQSDTFLTPEAVVDLRAACVSFGEGYMRLRELSRRSGVLAFGMKPKVHKVQHLPFMSESINPRNVQCYSEESLMGSCVKTWKGTSHGRYKGTAQKVVLIKRVTAVILRLELARLPTRHG